MICVTRFLHSQWDGCFPPPHLSGRDAQHLSGSCWLCRVSPAAIPGPFQVGAGCEAPAPPPSDPVHLLRHCQPAARPPVTFPRASRCPSRGRLPPPTLERSAVFSFHQPEPCSLLALARCANWNRLGRRGGLCRRKYFNEDRGCLHCYLLLLRASWLGSLVITAWIAG